jgi:very-short-patch-repair endonuclease
MASSQGVAQTGLPFQATSPIDGYVVDFACFHPKLAIEIDGGQHSYSRHRKRDAARDTYLSSSGFRMFRFWNSDVDRNLEGVLTVVLNELESSSAPTRLAPAGLATLPARGRDELGWLTSRI